MKKLLLCLVALPCITAQTHAQEKDDEKWQETPKKHSVLTGYTGESSVIIEDNTKIEYKDEDDKQVWIYKTTHQIVKILDEKGIESFNKVNVPVYTGQELKMVKARTILPNGTVIEVSPDKMKESKGDDGNAEIVFAMDGIEKNAEVELLFRYKKPVSLFGKEMFQYSIPVQHATFDIVAPERLKFEEKGYNGFPTVKDTLIDGKRYIHTEIANIPGLKGETYSMADLYRMRADYKVSYLPLEKSNVRVFTWQDMAKRLYSNIYELSDKEKKAADKYIETIGITDTDSEEEKIRKIENAIKTGITQYKEINDDNAWKLDRIIATRSATEIGLIRLFSACFVKAGIKHELGLAPTREQNTLDPDFENWNIAENYVYYFPDRKKYLSPASTYYRYPFTATEVIGSKGVFCKLTTLGDITNAIADLRTITPVPVAESMNNVDATISFTADMDATTDVTYSCTGYCAMGWRESALLLPKDKQKDMVQTLVSIADKPENIVKYAMSGEGFDNYFLGKPLKVEATVKTPQLVEKAGTKYLLSIGDVIGRQVELYQTSERKLPIDLSYPHYLNRTIVVNIPEGYKILNPEAIKLSVDLKDNTGKATTAFYSDYTLEGNKLKVTISEFYNQLHFPVSDYEAFRRVINASADFNKVTLLLAKG